LGVRSCSAILKVLYEKNKLLGFGNIFPKIKEVQEFGKTNFIESHPELCFLEIAGKQFEGKYTETGQRQRRRLLHKLFKDLKISLSIPATLPIVDTLDSLILGFTALYVNSNFCRVIGEEQQGSIVF